MKEYSFEIAKAQTEKNTIQLVESHSEFIRFRSWGGPGLFSEFEFSLQKSQNEKFVVCIECKEGEELMIEKGLRNCIDKLIEIYSQQGLQIQPFQLKLKNYRVHPIDTKPVCYEDPVRKRLCELIDEEEIFVINVKTNHLNSKSNFTTYEESTYHRHSKFAIMHRLPWLNEETLVLKDNWRFVIKVGGLDWHSSNATFKVDIQNHFQPNKPNYIAVEIDDNTPSFLAVSINNEILKFKSNVYARKLNLAGFKIKFYALSNWDAEYAEERLFNSLRINFRELIRSKDNYEIKEIKPVDNKWS